MIPKNIQSAKNEEDDLNTEITPEEAELLDSASDAIDVDDQRLRRSQLDSVDADGTPLNEKAGGSDVTGEDLDVPGSELDDADEAIGEEDEENNNYSQADTE